MGNTIRNPEAFNKAQEKRQRVFNLMVTRAVFHIEGVLSRSIDTNSGEYGSISGGEKNEVYASLIADGILGANENHKSIARAIKKSRYTDTMLSKDDAVRFGEAVVIVEAALAIACESGVIEMTIEKSLVRVALVSQPTTQHTMFDNLCVHVESLHPDDTYHPDNYALSGSSRSVASLDQI